MQRRLSKVSTDMSAKAAGGRLEVNATATVRQGLHGVEGEGRAECERGGGPTTYDKMEDRRGCEDEAWRGR